MKEIRKEQIRHFVHYAHSIHGFNNVAIENFIETGFFFVNTLEPNALWDKEEIDFAMKVFWEEIKPEEYMGYFVVNTDLKMTTGKTAAQVGHGATEVVLKCVHNGYADNNYKIDDMSKLERFNEWHKQGGAKVVLGATTQQMRQLIEDFYYSGDMVTIVDEGRTEDTVNKLTVIAYVPMKRKDAQQYVGHLKVLGYK